MSIEIDTSKFKEYLEIQQLLNDIIQENKLLHKRISYLEGVLSQIEMFNALGKTLRISEAIHAAINP
jgi:hypothetical protein